MDSAALKITSYNTTFKVNRKGKGAVPENSSFGFVSVFLEIFYVIPPCMSLTEAVSQVHP